MDEGGITAFQIPTWGQIAHIMPITLTALVCVLVGASIVIYCWKLSKKDRDK